MIANRIGLNLTRTLLLSIVLPVLLPVRAQTAVVGSGTVSPSNQGFPFSDETLNYSVNFPSGISLGEAHTTAKRDPAQGWIFSFSLDASLPSFPIVDRFNSYSSPDLCSLRFDRSSEHGSKKTKELTYYDRGRSVAIRTTAGGGGLSEIPVGLCPHDALTFLYYLRRELGQGRVPPNDIVLAGSAYRVSLVYAGEKKISRYKEQVSTDQINCTIKGPASEVHLEILLARDAVRTPLVVRCPFAMGTFSLGTGPLTSSKLRVAFWSPMPPSKSGIADYSAALASELGKLVDLSIFDQSDKLYDPSDFDIDVYHLGNNPHHTFVYDAALRRPGVVVMHEANLHHLIADHTIRRGNWDAYMAEVVHNGTARDVEFSHRVRAREVGPNYEGIKMTRRILGSAKGVIVHSQFMVDEMRTDGFAGPIARIPHGSWIERADGLEWRSKLGLTATTPLIGAFGFIKPYKRIAESLRAMRRLLRVDTEARMILVGEPHPEFPIHDLIRSLGLEDYVRVLGFTPIEQFTGYMSACDIILNLRFPTVGESSGSMLRALGLAKAVLVSDIGAFREYPDSVCLKVPVGAGEEDLIFEYLNLLVSRPELARTLGENAKAWVATECNWPHVASQYASFIEDVYCGKAAWEYAPPPPLALPDLHDAALAAAEEARPIHNIPFEPRDIENWAEDKEAGDYIEGHKARLVKTLEITPPGGADDSVLEMGIYFQITPSLKGKLGYGHVEGCYYGEAGQSAMKTVVSTDGQEFGCLVHYFDAEKDRFPYADEQFATVLCCELLEHLFEDPMFMMSEINRILKPGGHLVLTTPNIASMRALSGILNGYHPGFFASYIKPGGDHSDHPRHNREYTPNDIYYLLEGSGFAIARLETGEFRDDPHPDWAHIRHMLAAYKFPEGLRGDGIYALGRKIGPVRDRWPSWLYYC